MTFSTEEILEDHQACTQKVRAGDKGVLTKSMCDRSPFVKVVDLGHGFMFREVVKIRRKNPTRVKLLKGQPNKHNLK